MIVFFRNGAELTGYPYGGKLNLSPYLMPYRYTQQIPEWISVNMRHKGTSGDGGNIPYFVYCGSYIVIYICQYPLQCLPKMGRFHCLSIIPQ